MLQIKLSEKQYNDIHSHLYEENIVGSVLSSNEWFELIDYEQEWEDKWNGDDLISTVTLTFKNAATMHNFEKAVQNWNLFEALHRIRYNHKWIDTMTRKAAYKKQWCLSAHERECAEIILDAEIIKDNNEQHLIALCTDGEIHEVISWFTDEYSISEWGACGKSIEHVRRKYHDYITCAIRASHW